MTNLGALTTTFTPTGADCTSTYIGANNDNEWIQYGQPNTTQCVPPNFTAFDGYYYSPGVCPSGHTYACEAGVGPSGGTTQATCCPAGFTCRADYTRDTDPFACASYYTADTYLSAEYYRLTSETGGSTTGPATAESTTTTWYLDGSVGYYVEAYGPIVRRSAGDPEWSSGGSGTGTADSGSAAAVASTGAGSAATGGAASTGAGGGGSGGAAQTGSGLSVGASAGIGVGVGLGCIVFFGCIAAAYIIGKRRRKAQRVESAPDVPPYRDGVPVIAQVAEMSAGWRPGELQGKDYQQVMEMDGQGHRSELGSVGLPVELPGQAPSSDYYGHVRQ